jgi:hypothetical protein
METHGLATAVRLPPNTTRHRIAALLRFGINTKGRVWAARGVLGVSPQHERTEMADTHDGGGLCGAGRYRVVGTQYHALVCHCRLCQRRTGSACGLSVYCEEKADAILRGVLEP